MTAAVASETISKSKVESAQGLASDSKNIATKKGLGFIENMIRVMKISDQRIPFVFDFNPLLLLNPSSVMELSILTGVNIYTENGFGNKMVEKLEDLITSLEKEIPIEDSASHEKLKILREDFTMTKFYKNAHQYKNSYLAQVFN